MAAHHARLPANARSVDLHRGPGTETRRSLRSQDGCVESGTRHVSGDDMVHLAPRPRPDAVVRFITAQ